MKGVAFTIHIELRKTQSSEALGSGGGRIGEKEGDRSGAINAKKL
jgi:hypothetical protein